MRKKTPWKAYAMDVGERDFDPGDDAPRVYPSKATYHRIYKYFGDPSPTGENFWYGILQEAEDGSVPYEDLIRQWTIWNFAEGDIRVKPVEFDPERGIVDGIKVKSVRKIGNSRPEDSWISKSDLKVWPERKHLAEISKHSWESSMFISTPALNDKIRANVEAAMKVREKGDIDSVLEEFKEAQRTSSESHRRYIKESIRIEEAENAIEAGWRAAEAARRAAYEKESGKPYVPVGSPPVQRK